MSNTSNIIKTKSGPSVEPTGQQIETSDSIVLYFNYFLLKYINYYDRWLWCHLFYCFLLLCFFFSFQIYFSDLPLFTNYFIIPIPYLVAVGAYTNGCQLKFSKAYSRGKKKSLFLEVPVSYTPIIPDDLCSLTYCCTDWLC